MVSSVLWLLLLFGLITSSQSCPSNCVICLNAIYICNKWNPSYDLSEYDQISVINSNAFINAGNVISLDISTTTLNIFETDAFQGLTSLQTLDLSHNLISTLPDDVFKPLVNLKTLDLSHNQLSQLNPNAFNGVTNLTKLYINNNLLTSLTLDSWNQLLLKMTSLKNITLAHNDWHCDCNITALQSILMSPTPYVNDESAVTCNTPSKLYNNAIISLDFFVEPVCYSVSPSPSPSPSSSLSLSPSPSPSPSPSLSLSPSPSMALSSSPLVSSTSSLLTVSSPSISLSPSPSSSPTITLFSSSPSSPSSPLLTPTPSPLSSSLSSVITTFPSTSIPSPSPSPLLSSSSSISSLSSTQTSSTSPSQSPAQPSQSPSQYSTLSPHSSPQPSSQSSTQFSFPTSSPKPIPKCPATSSQSNVGTIHWKSTFVGQSTEEDCPYGPPNAVALRYCTLSPQNEVIWDVIQDGACFTAENRLQQISSLDIDEQNALELSQELANLPFNHLLDEGLIHFADIATKLITVGRSNILVLVNVLSAVDLVLALNKTIPDRAADVLQTAISTALLEAVNMNNTQILLEFSHLFIGGKYFYKGNSSDVIVVVDIKGENGLRFVSIDGNLTSEVTVHFHSDDLNSHTIQVTVYNTSDLFNRRCVLSEKASICNGKVISPVAVVTTNSDLRGNESVNVTFDNVQMEPDSTLYCAMWNDTINENQGGWDTTHCRTYTELSTDTVTCACGSTGAITIILVPNMTNNTRTTPSSIPQYSLAVKITFYIGCGLSILLHIPVIIVGMRVSCRDSYVRNIQALVNHGITQSLVFVVMIVSFQRNEIQEACLALGSLLHYIILVSYMWLVFQPIVLVISQIRRQLYEKGGFILPFFFMAWSLPIVPIVVYGVLTFTSKQETLNNCWLESFAFPSYFTYLSLTFACLVTAVTIATATILAFSGYTVTASSYVQFLNIFIETMFFTGVIALQFITAAQSSETFLVLTTGMILFCGIYFFIANGLVRPKIRNTILCQKDPLYSQGKPFAGQNTPSISSSTTALTEQVSKGRQGQRHIPEGYKNEMNYIGEYLGYPIEMLSEVAVGRRIRKKKGFLSNGQVRGSSEV